MGNWKAGLLPLVGPLPRFEFHVSAEARSRYGLDEALFSLEGSLLYADPQVAHRVAERVNDARDVRRYPEEALRAGQLYAAGLIDEIMHLALAVYREDRAPRLPSRLLSELEGELGKGRLQSTLESFVAAFPPLAVYGGGVTPRRYLEGESGGLPHAYVAAEEILLLWLANQNPANNRLGDLVADTGLRSRTGYLQVVGVFERVLGAGAGFGAQGVSLFEMLQEPARHSPTSLEAQLRYMRERWGQLLGTRFAAVLERLLYAQDLLAEERKGQAPGGAGPAPLLDEAALRGDAFYRAEAPAATERFSADASWMPRVVLLAKSTYVWLDQLSRRHGRDISRLDQIPDEELSELAGRGFTGLWLIGLWERSEASRRIKHIRGQPDAVASAYSLDDYVIAQDLGGEPAYENLRDRARSRGIRLASDMVPNHTGIDGRWVMEHPERFIGTDESPYPGYTFSGPDLSSDPRAGIYLEDHYYEGTDAAVVFKRVERATGAERYIYHGNDGTALPWNDTAQLDYLLPEVREMVIGTILQVARKFSIIRFDAAMVLAKEHIQRLWYPQPGHGGAIPSRARYGSMSQAEFDRHVPREFWREVVDRVAAEVPDTLLLAEAFWMMEGYFVRTLGMHRVYNSAFMNMLKSEDNAQYRQLVKNVLAFDPEILRRFVNFMNNPDEETALAQFGQGDKYFGVCTLMATMPGLPMFGHGQVEGFSEKYGMEYRSAKLAEEPDQELVARHRREIFPLLHRRWQFAEVEDFLLYDLLDESGRVAEDVFAYSNRAGGQASLVVFHNRYAEVSGRLRAAAPAAGKPTRTLQEGLALRAQEGDYVILPDHASGLEYLRSSREIAEAGFFVSLGAFKYHVFLNIREVSDGPDEPYARLAEELAGRGVGSIEDALASSRLRPLHLAMRRVLEAVNAGAEKIAESYLVFLEAAQSFGGREPKDEAARDFARAAAALASWSGPPGPAERAPSGGETTSSDKAAWLPSSSDRILLLVWAALRNAGAPGNDAAGLYRTWRLGAVVEEVLGTAAWRRARLLPLLLRHEGWAHSGRSGPPDERLLAALLEDQDALDFLQVNSFEGDYWFNREAYRDLTRALVLLALLRVRLGEDVDEGEVLRAAQGLRLAEARSGYRLDQLRPAALLREARADGEED